MNYILHTRKVISKRTCRLKSQKRHTLFIGSHSTIISKGHAQCSYHRPTGHAAHENKTCCYMLYTIRCHISSPETFCITSLTSFMNTFWTNTKWFRRSVVRLCSKEPTCQTKLEH